MLVGASLASLIALTAYCLHCLTRLRVTRHDVVLPEAPPELAGLRIALLSDFHLGRLGTSRRVIARALECAGRFNPDITALTGDYFDGPLKSADVDLLRPLQRHRCVLAVLGNHDYARGRPHLVETLAMLESIGAATLRNGARRVDVNGHPVWIVGLDDPFTLRDDIELARIQLPATAASPMIVLAHAPVLAALGDLASVPLVLCGHTHGGQIRLFPSGNVPGKRLLRWLVGETGQRRDPDFHRGIHRVGATLIVISDGLGVSMLPIRFRTRPEVILMTVRTP